jgi:glycosyltransferase involved in cell wall biosynthesis
MQARISVVLPARNEARAIGATLRGLREYLPEAEIVVVNDGSADETAAVAKEAGADLIVSNPYSMGNGAAIKRGAKAASGDILVFMDADGQHDPADACLLLERLDDGYDMVVGARSPKSQASLGRRFANAIYNRLSSWVTGHRIEDLTSGYRATRASRFREFLYLLPNGFSYPTTITMAFFRVGYSVSYLAIHAGTREGNSHIRPLRDGVRFLLIILKVATLYSPLKVFTPVSFFLFAGGLINYAFTYLSAGRFTNMSALLMLTSVMIFLFGLVAEQVSSLLYSASGQDSWTRVADAQQSERARTIMQRAGTDRSAD